jgi:hypothetical protein
LAVMAVAGLALARWQCLSPDGNAIMCGRRWLGGMHGLATLVEVHQLLSLALSNDEFIGSI